MDIKLELDRNFVIQLNKLKEKYGSKFTKFMGISDDELNFNTFIDRFTDEDVELSEVSINPTANSVSKDVVNLVHGMAEPHQKLLALRKLYFEHCKKFGYNDANAWLEMFWIGELYMHDAPSSTFTHYCYKGDELATYKYKDKIICLSFEKLYEYVDCPEQFDSTINQMAKFPKDLYVLDLTENGSQQYVAVNRIVKHNNTKSMYFLKATNGLSQIITEDHPVITTNGDVAAKDILAGVDRLTTVRSDVFDGTINSINNIELNNDIGWLTGMFLAEGCWSSGNAAYIGQKVGTALSLKLEGILAKYNINYTIYSGMKYCIKDKNFKNFLFTVCGNAKYKSYQKQLSGDFIHYQSSFLTGILSGVVDGDGTFDNRGSRTCLIRVASEALIQQLTFILNHFNIFARAYTPYVSSGLGATHKPIYGINFRLTTDTAYVLANSLKFSTNFKPQTKDPKKALNKIYTEDFGEQTIISCERSVVNCPVVYDITTATGHFICNNIVSHNCWAMSLRPIAERGLFFIDQFKTRPANHLTVFCDHVLETISWMSNRQAGAVGVPDLLIYMFYFWKRDKETDFAFCRADPEYYARQCMQKVIYDMNQPYLRVRESAFTNVSIMDHEYLIGLFGGNEFPDGTPIMDYIDDICEFQKWFMEELHKTRDEHTFTFPVISYCLLYSDETKSFVDEEFARWCSDENWYWKDGNFFEGRDITSLSSCCRLVNDTSKLSAFINSIGGTSLQVGSVKVSTINLRRIALKVLNIDYEIISEEAREQTYMDMLDNAVHIDLESLDVQRGIIKRNIEKGLLPGYNYGLVEFEKQYSTIGITGLYEALDEFGYIGEDQFGNKFYTEKALDFAIRILDRINELKDVWVASRDYSVNIEAVPGETCNTKFAKMDALLYPDSKDCYILGNQWIPLREKCTIDEKIRLGAILDKKCGGGRLYLATVA